MDEAAKIQVYFFQELRSSIPAHLSFVDGVSDVLNISVDSAYRRIRGETPLTIDEIKKLATHFRISVDKCLSVQSDTYLFSGKLINAPTHLFENWMEDILRQLLFINSFEQKQMYYLAKDLPVMVQFLLPELIAFKAFYWKKSILNDESLRDLKFSLKDINPNQLDIGKKIVEIYNQIPSSEIWNIESINSTIRQIEFYKETDLFDSEEDLYRLYKAIEKIINHLELQAEFGFKFEMGKQPTAYSGTYHLYNNVLELGDNTVLAAINGVKITFLAHSTINFITTSDHRFNQHVYESFQTQIKRSSQLSSVSEKERRKFFNRMRAKLNYSAGA